MIERIWTGRSSLCLLLLPFSLLYGAISYFIRLSYRQGWRKVWRAPVPVVVVGNLTVGGNGKTPVVIWLVTLLQQQGLRVGVVSRGYGGKTSHYPLLLTATTSPHEAGDEPVLIAQRTGAPVAVSPRRCEAVQALLAAHSLDIIVTDDGLQHYALARDIEIVVVDGERRFGNGWWLPAGPMRERAGRLRQVDAVIINGGSANKDEIAMQLQPGALINLKTGSRCPSGKPENIVAMAGIGHPPRFFHTLRQCGFTPVTEIPFADHQHYDEAMLTALAGDGQNLLMTEKDAVKCRSFAHDNWWYLPVNASMSVQAEKLLTKIIQLCR